MALPAEQYNLRRLYEESPILNNDYVHLHVRGWTREGDV